MQLGNLSALQFPHPSAMMERTSALGHCGGCVEGHVPSLVSAQQNYSPVPLPPLMLPFISSQLENMQRRSVFQLCLSDAELEIPICK